MPKSTGTDHTVPVRPGPYGSPEAGLTGLQPGGQRLVSQQPEIISFSIHQDPDTQLLISRGTPDAFAKLSDLNSHAHTPACFMWEVKEQP